MSREEILADGVRLICGDCREILPTLGKVDAVVTDPPYGVNLGNHGCATDGRSSHVLVKGHYASYDDTEENLIGIVVPAISTALKAARRGLVFSAGSQMWHFPKPDAVGGIFMPSAQGRSKWGFSSLAHCMLYGSAPALNLGAKATALYSTETSEKNGHPCPKPLGWMRWAVGLASLSGETIIDPFMGSGTTGVAAVKLGRKFIGIELEPKYFDIACRRIQAALDAPDMFVEPPKPAKQEAML